MSRSAFDILIPAYNARKTLPRLLDAIREIQISPVNIIVVSDGSTDGMADWVSDNYTLLKHEQNRGKGEALKTGFKWFLENSESSFLCCMDADLQHDPEDIQSFLRKIDAHPEKKVFIGARQFHGDKMPFHRVLSNRITSRVISCLTGLKVKDSQCGYRFIHRDILKAIHLREAGFQLESEFFFRLGDLNIQPLFINIATTYDGNGSHMNHFGDTIRFIKLIFREQHKKWFTHANKMQ